MKKLILCISTLAILAIACQKLENNVPLNGDEMAPAVKMITETISGSRGAETKATIADADASFAWTAGDNVAVHVSNGSYVYTSDEGASGATPDADNPSKASFTVVYPEGSSRDAFAVYPSTIIVDKDAANYGQSGQPLDVTLPSEYTLAQVSGETSPCPMIASNTGDSWDFYQLCSLLRLTVNNIPDGAKRLVIDFDGKKVCGDFSIASPVSPQTSSIATSEDASHDVISVTNDGSKLGPESLTVNIPLPVGGYSKITVYAYDEISGGNLVSANQIAFSYTATLIKAVRKTISLTDQSNFTFTFRDASASTPTTLAGLRFVRIFSCKNNLYNGATTKGPYTDSRATGETDLTNPVHATLKFASVESDQLAFQVIDANGKVYSGLYDAPDGFTMGDYDLTIDVKAYTFTVASGKKVYFSPGDLGVDNGVYSFTDPFVNWASGNTTAANDAAHAPAKRTWFDFHFESGLRENASVYGINDWRIPKRLNKDTSSYEWSYLSNSRSMKDGVNGFYRVTIPGYQYCLLLPPDETESTDIGDDLTSGTVMDYAKYLGKGFVLLFNTNAGYYLTSWKWGGSTSQLSVSQGYYWTWYDTSNRYYFSWTDEPYCTFMSNRMRNHIRYVRDVQ